MPQPPHRLAAKEAPIRPSLSADLGCRGLPGRTHTEREEGASRTRRGAERADPCNCAPTTSLGTSTLEIPASHLVMNGIRVVGSLGYKPRTDIPELLSLAAGKIDPRRLVSHRYRPEEINQAYQSHRQGKHHRAVVIWGPQPPGNP